MNVTTVINKYFTAFDKEEKYKEEKWSKYPKEDVFKAWDEYSKFSSTLGTLFHKLIEKTLKKEEIENKIYTFEFTQRNILEKEDLIVFEEISFPIFFKQEKKNFKKYLKNLKKKNYEIFDIEKKIIKDKITGVIDIIFYNPIKDKYLIVDWKWNKKIDTEENTKKALEPFEKLPDNKYGKICLQFFFYKNLLKFFIKDYEKKISTRIVRFYKDEFEKIKLIEI